MTEVPRRCPSIGCWEVVQGTKTLGGTNRGTEPRARCVDPGHTVLRIGQLIRWRDSRERSLCTAAMEVCDHGPQPGSHPPLLTTRLDSALLR